MKLINKLTVLALLIGCYGSVNAAVNDNSFFSCSVYNDKGDEETTKTDEEEPDCD